MTETNTYWEKKDLAIRMSQAYNLAVSDMQQQEKYIQDTTYIDTLKQRARIHYQILGDLQKEIGERFVDKVVPKIEIKAEIKKPLIKLNLPQKAVVTEEVILDENGE